MESWGLPLYACNDTMKPQNGHLVVSDAESGEVLYEGDFSASANATTFVAKLPLYYSEQRILLFRFETEAFRGVNHFMTGHPPFSLERYRRFLTSCFKEEYDEAFGL